jgi:hypothetical protein
MLVGNEKKLFDVKGETKSMNFSKEIKEYYC